MKDKPIIDFELKAFLLDVFQKRDSYGERLVSELISLVGNNIGTVDMVEFKIIDVLTERLMDKYIIIEK